MVNTKEDEAMDVKPSESTPVEVHTTVLFLLYLLVF